MQLLAEALSITTNCKQSTGIEQIERQTVPFLGDYEEKLSTMGKMWGKISNFAVQCKRFFALELAKRPITNEITNSFAILWALVGSLGIALGFVFLKR